MRALYIGGPMDGQVKEVALLPQITEYAYMEGQERDENGELKDYFDEHSYTLVHLKSRCWKTFSRLLVHQSEPPYGEFSHEELFYNMEKWDSLELRAIAADCVYYEDGTACRALRPLMPFSEHAPLC